LDNHERIRIAIVRVNFFSPRRLVDYEIIFSDPALHRFSDMSDFGEKICIILRNWPDFK